MVQEVILTDTTEVEMLSGEHEAEIGKIIRETDEGKYDILLEDSTIVEGVEPSQVNRLEEQVYSGNYLYIKNVDYSNKTIDIYYQSDGDIAGFQFNVDGIEITSAYGGGATAAGFMISASATTALGFSLSGTTIPAGKGNLLFIDYEEGYITNPSSGNKVAPSPAICLIDLVVSDINGNAIDFHQGECWVH
jgi:hypothetical protein